MKRGATKEEIILATQELIFRNGIRAVRVDEIAQQSGISKRTLYEMFTDKTGLINACLVAMGRSQRERIAACHRRRSGNALQRMLRVGNECIDGLCSIERSFLTEIRQEEAFVELFEENRGFWTVAFTRCLLRCREEELLLPEIDAAQFADQVLTTLFELRQAQISREELRLFYRTLLRGAATRKGIEWLDR